MSGHARKYTLENTFDINNLKIVLLKILEKAPKEKYGKSMLSEWKFQLAFLILES